MTPTPEHETCSVCGVADEFVESHTEYLRSVDGEGNQCTALVVEHPVYPTDCISALKRSREKMIAAVRTALKTSGEG